MQMIMEMIMEKVIEKKQEITAEEIARLEKDYEMGGDPDPQERRRT